jgi:hypothetical protein
MQRVNSKRKPWKAIAVSDGIDIFIIVDGVKVAKRGRPGTQQAKTWISLEPGWSVRDAAGGNELEVTYQKVQIQ